jgi:hypothetical protein
MRSASVEAAPRRSITRGPQSMMRCRGAAASDDLGANQPTSVLSEEMPVNQEDKAIGLKGTLEASNS